MAAKTTSRKRRTSVSGSRRSPKSGATAAPGPARIAEHRRRTRSIADIVDATFGELASFSPELWCRRSYMMVVNLLVEALITRRDELSTAELVSLSKALAEQRRMELKQSEMDHKLDKGRARPAEGNGQEGEARVLPPRFGALVERIYGARIGFPPDKPQPPTTNDER